MQALQSQTIGTVYAEEGLRRQVRILPVYHHKPILVSPKIQNRSEPTTLLGHNVVRAVEPLLYLGWRDRLYCVLC